MSSYDFALLDFNASVMKWLIFLEHVREKSRFSSEHLEHVFLIYWHFKNWYSPQRHPTEPGYGLTRDTRVLLGIPPQASFRAMGNLLTWQWCWMIWFTSTRCISFIIYMVIYWVTLPDITKSGRNSFLVFTCFLNTIWKHELNFE